MLLIKAGTADFVKIKNAYIDIAENTPDIDKYARYEYIHISELIELTCEGDEERSSNYVLG